MGLFDIFRRKKGKKRKEEPKESAWYKLQQRQIGTKRWMTIGEGDEFPDLDMLEEQGVFVPGYEYRIVKEITDESGRKKKEVLWKESFGEPVAKMKAEEAKSVETGNQPLVVVNTAELKKFAETLRQLKEFRDTIDEILNFGSKNQSQSLPTDMYEGKLPIWMHPQAAEGVGKFLGSIMGNMLSSAGGGTVQKKGGVNTLNDLDSELED